MTTTIITPKIIASLNMLGIPKDGSETPPKTEPILAPIPLPSVGLTKKGFWFGSS
jgi:hypothetical protein